MDLLSFYLGVLLAASGAAMGGKIASALPPGWSKLISFSAFLTTLMVVVAFFRIGWLHGLGGLFTSITGAATVQTIIETRGYTPVLALVLAIIGSVLGALWIVRVMFVVGS
jgi:hypothetical protein